MIKFLPGDKVVRVKHPARHNFGDVAKVVSISGAFVATKKFRRPVHYVCLKLFNSEENV